MSLRVLVGMDNAADVESLTESLKTNAEYDVTGVVGQPEALAAATKRYEPDVIILRLEMPEGPWLETVSDICRDSQRIGVIAMTDITSVDEITSMLKAGVKSIIPLEARSGDLAIAIEEASNGKLYIPARRANGA